MSFIDKAVGNLRAARKLIFLCRLTGHDTDAECELAVVCIDTIFEQLGLSPHEEADK